MKGRIVWSVVQDASRCVMIVFGAVVLMRRVWARGGMRGVYWSVRVATATAARAAAAAAALAAFTPNAR